MRYITNLSLAVMMLANNRSLAVVHVDDFSTTQVANGFVSGPGILGTERDKESYSPTANINSIVPGQLRAFNANQDNWGTIFLTYDGVDHSTSTSFLNGLGNVDLTQGGINDRFRIPVTSANYGGGSLTLTVSNAGFVASSITVPLPTSAGNLDLPFADFQLAPFAASLPVNFADVGHIELVLSMFPGESYTFDSILTMAPEPNTMTLSGVGGIAVAWLTRKRRGCGISAADQRTGPVLEQGAFHRT